MWEWIVAIPVGIVLGLVTLVACGYAASKVEEFVSYVCSRFKKSHKERRL